MEIVKQRPIPELDNLYKAYEENPNNDILKKLTVLSSQYCFTEAGLKKNISFLNNLPYNYKTCNWSAENFDSTYKAKWIPKNIPTLIFAGEQDLITPLSLFEESPDFQHENILLRKIKNAAHFPWIENPEEVKLVFEEYCLKLLGRTKN